MGIVVLGAVFVDIKGYPLAQYIPGGRNVGRVVQVHGGVSRNVAEDIAGVQLEPVFLSVVDNSGIGADVLARLEKKGVDTSYIRRTEDGLGTWLAIFDNQGDVTASISKRPDLGVLLDVLDESGDEIFASADSIALEIDMEEDLLDRVFELAEKHHKDIYAVVSNLSLAQERRGRMREISCLVCNEQEAGQLFAEILTDLEPEEMVPLVAEKAAQAGIRRMVVTLGERGAVYAETGGECGYCQPKKVDVIDTTGAGDAFFAGITIGLTYGKTIAEACEIGTILASAVIATSESTCPAFLPEEFGIRKR